MSERELVCVEVVELLTGYLEGALPAEIAAAVEEHLAGCSACGIYLEQMRQTIVATGAVQVDTLPQQAQADLVAAFRSFRRG